MSRSACRLRLHAFVYTFVFVLAKSLQTHLPLGKIYRSSMCYCHGDEKAIHELDIIFIDTCKIHHKPNKCQIGVLQFLPRI